MISWRHITVSMLLVLGLAADAVAAPLLSRLDAEQVCRYSQPRQSPFAHSPSDSSEFEAIVPGNHDRLVAAGASAELVGSEASNRRRDPMVIARETQDYVEMRGRVLLSEYQVSFDADAFEFLPYDKDIGVLGVSFAASATLPGTDVRARWVDTHELYFEVSAEQAEALVALRATKALDIVATVQIASREAIQRPFCVTDLDSEDPEIELLLLEGLLVTKGTREALSHGVSERFERLVCQRELLGNSRGVSINTFAPRVRVSHVASDGESFLPSIEASMLQYLAETELNGCYLHALQQNLALQGALVIEFSLDREGRVSQSGVLIDAANNPALTRCALQALESARIPRERAQGSLAVRMNLIFARQ